MIPWDLSLIPNDFILVTCVKILQSGMFRKAKRSFSLTPFVYYKYQYFTFPDVSSFSLSLLAIECGALSDGNRGRCWSTLENELYAEFSLYPSSPIMFDSLPHTSPLLLLACVCISYRPKERAICFHKG